MCICHLQTNNAEDTHVMREVTLIVPAVKWGCISRPVGVKMIYAAELERHCLLPGARCPPAAYFFTSFARVPGGRLLTEQLLQMDLKLDFTFNSCCCCCCCCPSSACAAASLLSLCLNTDQVCVRLGNLLFFVFIPHGEKVLLKNSNTVLFCVFFHSSTVSFLPAQMMEFAQPIPACVSHQHPGQQYAGMA